MHDYKFAKAQVAEKRYQQILSRVLSQKRVLKFSSTYVEEKN